MTNFKIKLGQVFEIKYNHQSDKTWHYLAIKVDEGGIDFVNLANNAITHWPHCQRDIDNEFIFIAYTWRRIS
jgi:hypothetical protein